MLLIILLLALCAMSYALLSSPKQLRIAEFYWLDVTDSFAHNGLLLGSSSIEYLPMDNLPQCVSWQNRGIGNALIDDIAHYVRWRMDGSDIDHVVLYAGENDIAYGVPVDSAVSQMKKLVNEIQARYPSASVHILGIKYSPVRQAAWPGFAQFNQSISAWSQAKPKVVFDDTENVKSGLFSSDGIHLTALGYSVFLSGLEAVCQ